MESVRRKLLTNPREKANIVSVLLFWWTIDIFRKGYRKVFELTDLYEPLRVDHSESLGDRLEKRWKRQLEKKGRPSLILAIVQTFWREYTLLGLICVINDVFIRLSQPLLLGQLLQYFRPGSTMAHETALYYAGGIVAMNAMSALIINQFFIGGFHNGMKVRVAVCSVIYRKALRLSQTALGETAVGKVVNLLSNDVNRFDVVSMFIHSMWTAPLMAIVVGYLLFIEVGWAGMIGIVIVFIVVPIQSYTGKLSSIFRLQTALRTDERVRFMDEIISGVQVIKMYAWELPFTKLITYARKMELNIVRKNSYVRGLYMTFLLFTTRMALFCTMLSIVLLYGSDQLTAAKVFVISAYFNIVSHTMSQMFVRGVAEIAEASVAFRRLQNFLEYEEKNDLPHGSESSTAPIVQQLSKLNGTNGDAKPAPPRPSLLTGDRSIVVDQLTARWIPLSKLEQKIIDHEQKRHQKVDKRTTIVDPRVSKVADVSRPQETDAWKQATLDEINISVKKGTLVGIVGAVGSGKTSLLQALLRELPIEHGTIELAGRVSYASQEPWVFAGSAKQNILFGQQMDQKRYDAVVKACAMTKDFEQFEHGDETIMGERGTSMSGGQKARLNLARAVYRDADIYLLDDPLSAVDSHVGKHLFNECIGPNGRLARRRTTRILVTHQVHFLKDADWVIILKDGKIESQGHPNDLAKTGSEFAELLQSEPNDDDDQVAVIEESGETTPAGRRSRTQSRLSLRSQTSVDKSQDGDDAKTAPEQPQQLEASSKGNVRGSVFGAYLRAGGNWFVLINIGLLFLITQILASGADYWVSYWTSQEELRQFATLNMGESGKQALLDIDQKFADEFMPHVNVSELSNGTQSLLLDTRLHESWFDAYGLLSTDACIYIHGSLMLGLFVFALTRSLTFYTICVRASQSLHDNMFTGLISTSMRFFDTNPSGRILNRFSKDMGATDEFLPKAVLDATQIIFNMFGAIIVTTIVNPWFLIAIVVLGVLFMGVRKVYLKTSKNLKRLDGITRSPVFTHLSATLNGLSTIRAFGAENVLIEEFDNHQDLHSACWYMFITSSSAFGLILDVICLVLVAVVTFSFLVLGEEVLGDQVGLAITQAMSLTGMLQWGIRQSAEVSNQLMSVERILEYRDLTEERRPERPQQVAKNWPESGMLEFRNVVYRYFAEAEPVLKGLTFVVRPQEKIGIVGRTGAGKSSLISAIFRLADVQGDIAIDGVNTADITLEQLRSRVSIIPQDPVLFSGTVRRNLDPFEEYADADIWAALEAVELKDIASGPMGLQTAVMSSGSNFSVGQRQLICLARAILRNNRVLVLDEATANVDPHTDGLIQTTIRNKFAECTVLTVAHRLHTIMDSDRVLVMDTGVAAEFAAPHTLLQQGSGIFYEMVHTLGAHEMERLCLVAREKFESTQKTA